MLTVKQTIVLRAVAALEREESETVRTISAIAEATAERGNRYTRRTIRTRLGELSEEGCIYAVQFDSDHPRVDKRPGPPPTEYSLTDEGWTVGFQECKAIAQDFGADPADLFEIDDIVTENWL